MKTDVGRSLARADINPVLGDARNSVISTVISNLEELSRRSFVVNTIETIATCVQLYGRDALLKSHINWGHKITAPRDIQIINCATLLREAAQINSVFLTFNIGPWTAIKKWEAADGPRDANEIAIALDDAGQVTPSYLSGDDKKIGSLSTIWENSERSSLFSTLIDVIAQAWQISPSELLEQPGWTHENNWVYGRLRKQ